MKLTFFARDFRRVTVIAKPPIQLPLSLRVFLKGKRKNPSWYVDNVKNSLFHLQSMAVTLHGDLIARVQNLVEVESKLASEPALIHLQHMVEKTAVDLDRARQADNATSRTALVSVPFNVALQPLPTIMDKSLQTNLLFWRFCTHTRRKYNFIYLLSSPSPHKYINLVHTCNFSWLSTLYWVERGNSKAFLKGYQCFFKLQLYNTDNSLHYINVPRTFFHDWRLTNRR